MKNLEKDIYEFLENRGWENLRPSDLAKSLSIETAELLELFQWSNESLSEVKQDEDKLTDVKKEIADIFIYAYQLTILLELDTERVIYDKLEKISEKYPPELMKQRAETNTGSGHNSNYWQIKRKYRQNNNNSA
jgi:NTP pyrophosphatase (non-canonical NTP hydrolase)